VGGDVTWWCDVTVHVTDVNDNSPRWSQPMTSVVSVELESSQGAPATAGTQTAVITLSASDLDAGNNATITYSLHTGHSAICHGCVLFSKSDKSRSI